MYLFGALRIEQRGCPHSPAPGLGQPKRLAFLARLAAAAIHGPIERDLLMSLFWPGARESDARRALNQTVHYLRSQLGADALLSFGSVLQFNPQMVSCDLIEFAGHVRAGRFADALDLYTGDLLESLRISGCASLDDWLDRARNHWREEAAETAWKLADRCRHANDDDASLYWARRAYGLRTGLDETALRRILLTHHRLGNRSLVLRLYDEFARELEATYSARPSINTRRLLVGLLREDDPADALAGAFVDQPQRASWL